MLMSQAKLHNISNAIKMGLKKNDNHHHCSAAVLYHYPCPDGAFAALAAHLYFKATSSFSPLFFPNTVYNPIRFFPHSAVSVFVPFILLSVIVLPCMLLLCLLIYVYVFFVFDWIFQGGRSSSGWNWWSLPPRFCGAGWFYWGNLYQSSKVLALFAVFLVKDAVFNFSVLLSVE